MLSCGPDGMVTFLYLPAIRNGPPEHQHRIETCCLSDKKPVDPRYFVQPQFPDPNRVIRRELDEKGCCTYKPGLNEYCDPEINCMCYMTGMGDIRL